MTTALLQTTYFGPIQWYQKLYRYDRCVIEQYDSYQKQTFRNRCVIATANGTQALTVPVEHNVLSSRVWPCEQCSTFSLRECGLANNVQRSTFNVQCKDLRISDHNQWRRVHWNALQSAYSESPFFDYYADDIRPFFEQKYEFLIDFNEAIRQKMCELIDIRPTVNYTTTYLSDVRHQTSDIVDFRDIIHVKHPLPDPEFTPKTYWQVFQHKHGFLPNLSILDLLFCMGPESIFYL